MMRLIRLLMTAALSAGGMYFFDKQEGSKRRAMLKEQATKLINQNGGGDWQKIRDQLTDRARGMAKEIEGMVKNEQISDETLMARVRSQMGHVVSNSSAINVAVNNGTVTLSGPILKTEEARLMATIAMIPGVKHVENMLDAQNMTANNIPSMQTTGMETTTDTGDEPTDTF